MPLLLVAGVRNPIAARRMFSSTSTMRALSAISSKSLPSPPVRLATPSIILSQSLQSPAIRAFSTFPHRRNTVPTSSASAISSSTKPENAKELASYAGPLASTFTRLKLFSLGSLGLASVLTPILLLAPGEISLAGRVGLCITALATSAVSTALIAWIGTPYVGTMRLLQPSPSPISTEPVIMELNTVSWRLKPQKTLVYEPDFLRPTSRPFASWEITNSPPPLAGDKEVVKKIAETFDVKTGTCLGSWNVRYTSEAKTKDEGDGEWKLVGKTEVTGKPNRYFNVHEELIGEEWQVLG